MAIKSINLLPEIFRSDANRKFLNATVDQLISENTPTTRLDSYIGRQDAVTWKSGDTYIAEPTTQRANYQLEPSIIVDAGQGQTDFYSSYQDLLNQISFYGGLTNDHSRLFTNQTYNFDGVFDFDKFVNFTQYLWLPNGPPEVTVSANAQDTALEYNVERSTASQSYQFTEFDQDRNPIITLVKGTRYRFRVNQPGFPFWIQTRPGPTGTNSAVAEALSRTIYGLENNGIDVGTIEFNVPASDAQGSIARATLAATVDFATTLSYNQVQSHLTTVLNRAGGLDGVFQSLNGKTLIFINQDGDNESWQDPGNFDYYSFDADSASGAPLGFSYGETVPGVKRFGVFRIRTVNVGSGRELVQLDPVQDIANGEKVYVRAGVTNSNVEFIKNTSGYFVPVDPVTSPLTELYYQDNSESGFFGSIKLVEPGTATLNVETDILNRANYTAPNGVRFTNGLHIRFDQTATPSNYAGNAFIVEGAGTGIRLVPLGNLAVSEQYGDTTRLAVPDYITINRGSKDLNAWSRSNRWFHIQTVEAAAVYRNDPDLLNLVGAQRGKRPIIEFAPDIYLFEYGRQAKSPVDILDFTVTDAFRQVEGKTNYVVQMPNGVTRQLTPGTRIIFASDLDPEVRRRIYRVDQIVTASGVRLHLVSQNTLNLPTYTINSAIITSNLAYNFVPSVTFASPLPGVGTVAALGNVVLKDTGLGNIAVIYGGMNYIADPYIEVSSEFQTAANVEIVYKPFKQVDYIRIDYGGTGYINNTPNVSISNPNEYWGRVSNASVGTTGLTFEINAAPLQDSVSTTVLSTDGTGNLNITFSNIGLGYFSANANVTISAPNLPNGIPAVVNTVHLFANGAIKAVNLLSNGSGYLASPTISFTGANSYPASASSVATVTGPGTTFWDFVVPGMQVIANGIIGGSVVAAVDNEANLITINAPAISANLLLDPPVTGLSTVTENDIWIFKANVTAGTFATVATTVIDSQLLTVDNTDMIDTGMIVNGGSFPVAISDIRIDVVPTRIITTTEHGLVDGDLILLRSIVGTTELNFSRYYVAKISDTAIELYSSADLNTAGAQDSRNFTNYVSGGTVTAYTIDYARIKVNKVLSQTQILLDNTVSVRAGTKLVFGGVQATAIGRSDGNQVYNIAVTNPGSGYITAPNVTIDSSAGNQALASTIANDDIINYINIVDPGTGYRIGSNVSVRVIPDIDLVTTNVTAYGSSTLYFENSDLTAVQPGWLVFLETSVEGQAIYTDFAQIPYAETEVTGPNDADYRSFMDVSKTRATILTVASVDFDRIEVSGPVLSLDSDGEVIDLPIGTKIHLSAQNRFFTNDGRGSGERILGETKNNFVITNEAVDTTVITLNSVLGVQTGMVLQTLAGTLLPDITVVAVDSYINRVTLNKSVTVAGNTPVRFSFNSTMTVNLQPAEIDFIDITDEGSGYTSAPSMVIEPLVPVVEKIASCDGTNVLSVDNFEGIQIGSKVTSSYDTNGVGITTGNDVPVVTELFLVQTGSATFESRVRLNKTQPVFSDILVTFTYAAEAVAQVTLENQAIVLDDETPETYDVDDTVLVNIPANETQTATNTIAYNQFYFNGTNWLPAQQKNKINQEPLFDAFDENGFSAGNAQEYPGSKFRGTKIFGYREGIGQQDAVLGFPLVYRNFENVGDIEFENFFQRDTFNYLAGFTEATVAISNFVLREKTSSGFAVRNIWATVAEPSKQYQVLQSVYDGTTNYFEIDALPEQSRTVPYLKVYVGTLRLPDTAYTVTQFGGRYAVVINVDQLVLNERVIIKVFSMAQSKIGKYETPANLDYNPLNTNFDYLTLGQVRNHLRTQADNNFGVVGSVLGSNNLRDLDTKAWQGSILQHSGSLAMAKLFLTEPNLNAINAIEFAAKEYTKFKNRFLDMTSKIQVDTNNIPGTVDKIMASIMLGKSSMSAWYDSDMLPWGNKFKTITTLPVLNIRQKTYLIPATFDPTVLSTRSVLVYLKDTATKLYRQLIRDIEVSFATDISSIVISDSVELTYSSQLVIVDVGNTTECYVPETPSKLGLYPKFVPHKYLDDTYRTPVMVIQGHDGSITPAFNDYRDDILLELELRIYNNIKVNYDNTLLDIYNTVPGAFRDTGYDRNEWNTLLTKTFLSWIGNNKLDYSDNKWFLPADPWTWNYTSFQDKQKRDLPGFWRGIYKWYYDTDRPHLAPWEMLGFSQEPDWWQAEYGSAPYTGGNKNLWEDLELGVIQQGPRAGIDARFARPGLSTFVPVDSTGLLRDPLQLFVSNFNSVDTSASFAIGDHGPVESAWRRSSDYAFSVQIASVLARPAQYLGTMFDVSRYFYDTELGQIVYKGTRQRLIPDQILIPSSGLNLSDVVLTAGYANWVRDYLVHKGINGTAYMSEFLRKLAVRLSYKVAGFTDKRMLEVVAEQSSPGGSGKNIIIPDENYRVYLNKGVPTRRVIYSAVIVERTDTGFKLSGYDSQRPFWTIVPSEPNNNAYTLTELNESVVIYRDYKRKKVDLPYGVEFKTLQQVADFLASYARWLLASGFVFGEVDQDLGIAKDWNLSIREFLTWAQQGWKSSSVIILSPVGSTLTLFSEQGIVDEVTNKNIGNRLLDQNFALIRSGDFTVNRSDNVFSVTALYNKMIALADLTLVEYEHVLIFDNTTVFSDVIYQPELGNRQFRLRLIGYKTGNWTGQLSAPGYVFNDDQVDEWVANKTYNIGSLVSFKDRYYVALEKVPESINFDFLYWRPINRNQIKTGLLPNFSNQADRYRNFYDIDQVTRDETVDPYANGLLGFRTRQFLQDLGIDTKAQLKFYQGYIKQKGTRNAVNNLVRGEFDRVASDIDYFEEWALRVGEYGATGSDQYVEVVLDDQVFTEDPSTIQLLNLDETGQSGAVNFNPRQVYRYSAEVFDKNIIKARTDLTPRISDNVTAGYPRLDDVDGTIYDIEDYQNYADIIAQIGAGFKLWVAVDTNKSWNVYRATETDVLLLSMRRTSSTDLLLTFDKPHGTRTNELIVVKNFAEKQFDGFYRVKTVEDNLNVTVTGYRSLETFQQITTVEGTGVYLRMLSVRYKQVNEIISFTPPHGWRDQDRAWIDNDTGKNVWGVFQKTDGWDFNQLLPLRQGEDRFREGYGHEVKLSIDNQIAIAGTPKFTTGSLTGLRVINPGSNYSSPAIRISNPTGPVGQLAQFTALKDNGTLLLPNLITAGSGYTFAPNVTLSDQHQTVTTAETVDDDYLYLSAGDMDNIFIGDSVTGQGIPAGYTVVEEPNVIPDAVKIGGPSPAALSSATTVTIGLGLKEFVTAVDADTTTIVAGQGVRILRFGSTTDYMEGYIVSFVDQLLTAMIEIEAGSGTYSVWNITSQLSVRSGTAITFERGIGGRLATRLAPTSIDYIQVVNGGSGFVITPSVEIFGGGGSGATATAQISGGVIQSITLTNAGSGYTEAPEVVLLTNNTSTVDLRARLLPSAVGNLIITDKGTGYRQPQITVVPDTRDVATGATASLSFFGNGGISGVTVIARGSSYGAGANINIANSNTGGGFVGSVSTFANGKVNSVTVLTPGSGYNTSFAAANIFCFGGVGATGNVGRTVDGIADFSPSQVISYGQGYLDPPTVTVIDQTGSGSGAVIEAVMPTGQVKTFLRPNQNTTSIEETQLIKPYNDDAREFGYSLDIGTTLAAIGSPGTYNQQGGVFISQTLGSQWISYQLLFPPDVEVGDRFGHSVAITDDQQWIYVGSPGANKVYAYGKRSQVYSRVTITPVTGQLIYPTNLAGIKTAQELKVIGSTGKIYEPNFDYAVDTLGTIYFADFARISNQSAIYVTRQRLQTTITPEIIRNLIVRTYALQSRPETIDQLLVYGATGRVFVPYKEYTVVGSNLVFLDDGFLAEPTITVNQREVFYQLVETIVPPDTVNADANFGWSVRVDSGGYRILIGAPDYDGIDEDENTVPSAGRAYVFNRSFDVVLSVGTNNIYTFPALRAVTSVRLNNVILAENIDYSRSGNSIIFNQVPSNGSKINVDTNFFNIVQVIEAPSVINLGRFGRSVDISADNKTLVIGSPGYRDENYYNGQVYRYVNKGLFYGTVSTTKDFLQTSVFLGDTIKINDTLVTFSNITPGATQNVSVVYSTISSTISLTSNVGLSVGDQVIGPDILRSDNAKISSFSTVIEGVSANVILSVPVTVTAGDSLQFLRAADNLDKIKRNFDAAGAVAVQANVNAGGTLTLAISNEFALTTLDILPGTTGNVLAGIGLSVYGLTQVLQHPRYGVPEKFGTKVAVDDAGTVLIASEGGNTLKASSFDKNTTLFDGDTTRYIDSLNASGAVYVYDYLSPPGETFDESGKLLYNQVLQNAQILTGDNFGSSVDINQGWALVGADRSDYYSADAGAVHLFINDKNIKGWSRLRERGNEIDIDYINKGLIYDNQTQLLTQDLDYFDPAKGKILGIADQDLDYKSSYDPATYNKGTRSSATITQESFWGEVQETQTWWDLSLARYINYEQGPLNYRGNRWGQLFPDSQIQVCEWVGSLVLPSEYATEVGDGEAKYPDNSAYVETQFFDTQSGLIKTKYYYWVINKQGIDKTKTKRVNSVVTLETLIRDPAGQGIPYFAAIASNAFNIYNVKNFLNAQRTTFRVEYSGVLGEIISHNEYELIQQGNANSIIPSKLISKMIDSLSGENSTGSVVPDLRLNVADAYGISNLPRQSMIINNLNAAKVFVTFVNNVLASKRTTGTRNLAKLLLKENVPAAGVGFYDSVVNSIDQLQFIPESELFIGFKVLVEQDSDFFGFWTIYEYQQFVGFRMIRIQSFDTTRWWNYKDWYASGFDEFLQIDFTVPKYSDILRLDLVVGNIVKVLDSGKGSFTIYQVTSDGRLAEIVEQNGTIALSTALYDPAQSLIGFDNSAFDQVGFSTTQAVELRNIFEALAYDIFVEDDQVQVNNLFFTLLNYILSEQLTVDWAIKTSFINVLHKIRKLEQFTNYIKDNQDYYEQYINEVKPYRTQIREYLLDYEGTDILDAGVTDFDFPSIYDKSFGNYRVLNIGNSRDLALINGSSRKDWLDNYKYQIQDIRLNFGGSGYTGTPRVVISGGGGTGATARAVLGPFSNGTASVVDIILTSAGSGYTSTPAVLFEGGNGENASATVQMVQQLGTDVVSTTLNKKVRSIFTKLKFDRVSYTSNLRSWKPYEIYHPGDIIVLDDVRVNNFANYTERPLPRFSFAYRVLRTLTGRSSIDLNVFEDTTVVEKLAGNDLDNANDRLAAYLQPGSPDQARIYSTPNTVRLVSSFINDQIISVAKQWNSVRHSGFFPVQHGYQYAAVGDASLIALSKDGQNWVTNRITNTTLNVRDVALYRNYTWVVVANQGTIFTNDNGEDWIEEKINEYRYDASNNDPAGKLQENTAQTLDMTGVASVMSTYSDYLIVAGNNGLLLANPRGNSFLTNNFEGWYNIKVQRQLKAENYLTLLSVDRGDLTDIDGSTFDVEIQQISGFFVESNFVNKKTMKAGFVLTAGVNGAIYAITYNALDDYLQGFVQGYNYNNGKNNKLNYPWQSFDTPVGVKGLNDDYSGEQITKLAVSDSRTNWAVAIGSAGTLLWNQFNLPIQTQLGRAELAPDTIGKTVVDHGLIMFNNFRKFDLDNFVAPLTRDILENYDLYDITWDGEKFVVVGASSIILWGYPNSQPTAYIEIGSIDPSMSIGTRRDGASWSAGTNVTSRVITVPAQDLDIGGVVVGMTCYADGLPDDATVTLVVGGTNNHEITVSFATATVSAAVEKGLSFAYVFTANVLANSTVVASNGVTTIDLNVSANATVGTTRFYVDNYDDRVQSNWTLSGTGLPADARVKYVGKFAEFNWQYAPGVTENINLNYRTVSVNTTVVEISKPLLPTGNLFAGNIVTFSDPTGTIIQLPATQDLPANAQVLTFANIRLLDVGYTIQANSTLGIQDGTAVTKIVQYNIGGVESGLTKDIPDNVPGTSYLGSRVQGTLFTETVEDNLALDTIMRSEFTDNLLGQRPEDIVIDGGKFIDTYSSHAPEELVPGQVIDSLQMNVFTANVYNGNIDFGNIVAFKIFTDYKLPSSYFRLTEANTTALSANLAYDDTEVFVSNIARLPDSGSVWINAERIIYQGVDRVNGKLIDIRRGSLRTAVAPVHTIGSLVSDASISQQIATDVVTPIAQDIVVENGIVGGGNTSTYLSSAISSIKQGRIWLDLD